MQTIAPMAEQELELCCAAKVAGFNLNAGILMSKAQDRSKPEVLKSSLADAEESNNMQTDNYEETSFPILERK